MLLLQRQIGVCRKELEYMEIRKLAESDYDKVIKLYQELDELHVQARPDFFVSRDKDEVYPKDAFIQNLANPDVMQLGVFDDEKIVSVVRATLWKESGMVKDIRTVCLYDILQSVGGEVLLHAPTVDGNLAGLAFCCRGEPSVSDGLLAATCGVVGCSSHGGEWIRKE